MKSTFFINIRGYPLLHMCQEKPNNNACVLLFTICYILYSIRIFTLLIRISKSLIRMKRSLIRIKQIQGLILLHPLTVRYCTWVLLRFTLPVPGSGEGLTLLNTRLVCSGTDPAAYPSSLQREQIQLH